MANNVVVDLTNYKDRVGSRVAPGDYKVVVEDAELTQSKAGNDMINLWFRVKGGPHDGATIVDRLTLSEKALFRVVGFMQAVGMPTPNKRLQINIDKFKNQVLEITVEDGEPYNGRVKSEVRAYTKVQRQAAPSESIDSGDDEQVEESEPVETTVDVTSGSQDAPAPSDESTADRAEDSNPWKSDNDGEGKDADVDLDDLEDL